MTTVEIYTYVGTAIAGAIGWVTLNNTKLREGITDSFLNRMNQTKINVIDLHDHRAYGLLKQRSSTYAHFVIENPLKLKFYQTYISIAFDEMEICATNIIAMEKKKSKLSDTVMQEIYTLHNKIESRVTTELNIPDKVQKPFSQWRNVLSNSFNDSIKELLNDDLVKSDYFLAYRILDTFCYFTNTLLHTSVIEMKNLNGSFDNLTHDEIFNIDGNP